MSQKRALYLFSALLVLLLTGVLLFVFFKNPAEEGVSEPTSPPNAEAKIGLTLITSSLSFPTAVVATPNKDDKRLFVLERGGVIKIINSSGKLEGSPFLDITSKVQADGEMGLLGLAFHPQYKTNGQFFINYIDKDRNTVVARYIGIGNQADPASEKVILTVSQPYANHNGGDLAFGPDGFLYIPLGDGGSGGDPQNRAQDLGELLGKILRIDIDKGDPYSIPADNPFVGRTDVKKEIWTYGWRNPWRISFDKEGGDMWVADVGQGEIEEIDFEANDSIGGGNYGWRCYEGTREYNLSGCGAKEGYISPILEYDHSERRCSVTGGFVYRGERNPTLTGKYFYADFCGGQLYLAEKKNDKWESSLVLNTPYKISTFGQDSGGELYLTDFETGSLYLIQDLAN